MREKPELKIDWATYEAARYACERWHYSGSLPVGKMVKIGAWEDERFIGVVLFSYGANYNIGKPYGLKQSECCELTRVALRDHVTPVSKILIKAIKLLKQNSPGLRLIISYADTGQGHHGGIYQATNWIYEGCYGGQLYVKIGGKIMHKRQAYSLYGSLKSHQVVYVPASRKHKYLFPLDRDMRKKVAPLAKPYPKRDKRVIEHDTYMHSPH